MPFRPELNFFYLYIKRHLEEVHGLNVERGDSHILTKALMDKIRGQIQRADIVISDVTGGNPNVFYEIGLAHAFNKPVVFLTQDSPKDVPVDVRQFEFIEYHLSRHEEFLVKLDNAVRNVFVQDYESLFVYAQGLLKDFNGQMTCSYRAASLHDFQARVMKAGQVEEIPGKHQEALLAEFLLPKIIADTSDVVVMRKVTEWVKMRWHNEI